MGGEGFNQAYNIEISPNRRKDPMKIAEIRSDRRGVESGCLDDIHHIQNTSVVYRIFRDAEPVE